MATVVIIEEVARAAADINDAERAICLIVHVGGALAVVLAGSGDVGVLLPPAVWLLQARRPDLFRIYMGAEPRGLEQWWA